MQDKKFLIVGTVKNCSKTLFNTINCIDKAFSKTLKYKFFLVESDSTDNTSEILRNLKKKRKDFDFESCGFLKYKLPNRTERIAYCRNKYLNYLFKNSIYKWVDYLVVADFDGVCSSLNERNLSSCWEHDGWDVMTSNNKGLYYDIYALRHDIWSPNNCWEYKKALIEIGYNHFDAERQAVKGRMIKINPNAELIKVNSAFGGLAIYKKIAIPRDALYKGKDNNGQLICEHVIFNSFITSIGGNIYINPQLIIGESPKEHVLGGNKLFIFLKKLIRIIKSECKKLFS